MLKSMRNCLQVFLLDRRTDKANDNFKKINRMKKFITLMILSALCLGAKAQQINGDFSTWEDCHPWVAGNYINDKVGSQPQGWRASNVYGAGGTGKNDKFITKVSGHTDGYTGVQILNVFVGAARIGAWAPGYLSLGTPWNTSKGKSEKDGGCFGGMSFIYKPDAIVFNYKFSQSKSKASFVGYLWKGTWTQTNVPSSTTLFSNPEKAAITDRDVCVLGKYDASKHKGDTPTSTTDAQLIASYETYVESSVDNWTACEIPFTYVDEDAKPEKINIIFSSADYFSTTGAGTDKASVNDTRDVLTIDDVKLIYYHSLAKCTYDGQEVTFDDNDSASVSALYDESKLFCQKKGVGATVKKAYNNATGKLTITVEGNDNSADNPSVTTYTIQFKKPSDVVSEKSYTETLYVTINGETTDPQEANVLVQTRYDGKFNFVLKNFVLGGEMPVGNINVPSLTKNPDGSFSFQGITSIEAGDLEDVAEDEWIGPGLGEVPLDLKGQFVGEDHLRVSIDIDMTSTLEQFIYVHLGYDAASLAVNSAAQYGTFCAPFDVTIPQGVTAYIISGIAENGKLTLVEQQNTIPAHTPVIVYSESASGINEVQFGVATTATATSKYLTGVYTDTKAPVGSYVLQNQRGRVGFYQVQEGIQPMVRANRAYLTVPASANVKAFYMDDATAIQTVEELLSGKAEIYDLAGRRQQKLQKGINIVGGKKVLVK